MCTDVGVVCVGGVQQQHEQAACTVLEHMFNCLDYQLETFSPAMMKRDTHLLLVSLSFLSNTHAPCTHGIMACENLSTLCPLPARVTASNTVANSHGEPAAGHD